MFGGKRYCMILFDSGRMKCAGPTKIWVKYMSLDVRDAGLVASYTK